MKLTFTSYANIQTATADEINTYEFEAGVMADVPDEVAVLFIESGVAQPAKATRATKTDGETATK